MDDGEIAILSQIASTLQFTADLVGSDIFIDCFYGAGCIVVAEAKPCGGFSIYSRSIVGEDVCPENEPAVFAAKRTELPVRNLRATTQENKLVRQDVVPIKNLKGKVFAALIREKDVSDQVLQDRKYVELTHMVERQTEDLWPASSRDIDHRHTALKEMHHRIKNNLQMVASLLNMQSRRSTSEELRRALKENVSRILSFAAIHDILTHNGLEDKLPIMELIESIRNQIDKYFNEHLRIQIKLDGDNFLISSDKATSIAIVLNELLSNAVEHAFLGRREGNIVIGVQYGEQYSTITVSDDGIGFDFANNCDKSLGLSIVSITIRDRLHGKIRVFSGEDGSKIQFNFLS